MNPSMTLLPRVRRRTVIGLLAGAALAPFAFPTPARAMTIERVKTPRGFEVWLVRDAAVPLISLEFAFLGGASQDPEGKPGLANLSASLLDEGAGPFDAKAFQYRLERKAIELSFRAGRDHVRGTLRTLKENRDEAFDYLRLALTAPRFDGEAVERMRVQTLSQLRSETTNPNSIAGNTWWASAFPGHPYGRPLSGTLDSVPRIAVEDLKTFVRHVFARDNLTIAVVGDIDADSVARMIDRTFGDLPSQAEVAPVSKIAPHGIGRRIVTELDVPQAVITFGGFGIGRGDPDFFAAYIVNHILGGGSFSSRLYSEVREKRGLAYGIYTNLSWLNHAAVLIGGTATRADAAGQTIGLIENEIRKMAAEGPTEEEFVKAKTYLKGSFALGLDTSGKIASQLVQMQLDNLGIDYIDRRIALIDAVTLPDARRVAKRLLEAGLLVTVAGRPKGVTTKEGG
jgi:zinc protease